MASDVQTQLGKIHCLDELQGFQDMLCNPPPGVIVKAHTEEDMRMIALRKIELQKGAR